MHKQIPLCVFLIMMCCASLSGLKAQNMEKHTWKNRILVIKTSDSASVVYQEQIKEFRDAAEELKVRKFVFYKITGDYFELMDFTNPASNESGKITGKPVGMTLTEKENFEVILIGLDGGVKLQQKDLLRKEDLFDIVDAMPMRRNELNRKNE